MQNHAVDHPEPFDDEPISRAGQEIPPSNPPLHVIGGWLHGAPRAFPVISPWKIERTEAY